MNQMLKDMYDLFSIIGPSGKEEAVAKYLGSRLKPLLDGVERDEYGNLLGELKVGSGEGKSILLSAHMDTVDFLVPGRRIEVDGFIYRSSSGILGGDDRAGIAIVLEVLRFMPGRNHEAGGTHYWGNWKYFVKRKHGPKIRTITLDPGIALLLKAISAVGISTMMCCDGHGRRAPYVMFDGAHNGIWFDLIQKQWMQEIKLHYSWEVRTTRSDRDMVLQAKKEKEQRWDVGKIQEDAYGISEFLLDRMESLSDLKRHIFGRRIKPTKRLIAEMTLEEKRMWMTEKWETYFSGADNHRLK